MSRIRVNNVSGTASNNPITLATATTNTCTWPSAPAFPLIARPDYLVITLEPDTTNEEIIHLFGYTPGGTTGLVMRAAEPNAGGSQSAVAHSAVAWVHAATAMDYKSAASRAAVLMVCR